MADRREDMLELDACLARVPMPEQLEARIIAATTLRAVEPSPLRRFVVVGLAFATGVALTVLALRDRSPSTTSSEPERADSLVLPPLELPAEQPARPAPGLTLTGEACEWSSSDLILRFETGCRIRLAQPAMDLEIWAPTRLQANADGVVVDEGEVMFVVEHVEDPSSPARVGVSGGTIEVLGTRFAIRQTRDAGHVDLLDGAIVFRRLDGEVEAIEPGARYRWSSATPSDAGTHPAPHPVRPSTPADQPEPAVPTSTLDDELAEVARLRRAGDLDAAIAKLDALAREQSDPRTLEVISYERGTLVQRSATTTRACETWFTHRRSFPAGRYHAEVERRLENLHCVPK